MVRNIDLIDEHLTDFLRYMTGSDDVAQLGQPLTRSATLDTTSTTFYSLYNDESDDDADVEL